MDRVRSYGIYLWHYPIFCFTRPASTSHTSSISRLAALHVPAGPYVRSPPPLLPVRRAADPARRAEPLLRPSPRRAQASTTAARPARVVIGGSCTLIAVMLGAGLANASPEIAAIPGIDEAAHKHDNGAKPDANVVASLGGPTTAPKGGTTPSTPSAARRQRRPHRRGRRRTRSRSATA